MADDQRFDELEQRLRALGGIPVDPALEHRHLAAMAAVGPDPAATERKRWRFTWRAVAAAAVVGFLAGSTGLAAAGSLPDPAQDVAHDVLDAVGIDVPRSTEGCPEGRAYRNHGHYVSEVEAAGGDVEAAAHSACGMPAHSGGHGHGGGHGSGGGQGGAPGVPRADTDGDPCTGPPPWAGAHLPRDQREALQAEHAALCPDDADEAEEPDDVEEPEAQEQQTEEPEAEETTTTVAEETTTTVEETTTTIG